jgi:hypothetical protein
VDYAVVAISAARRHATDRPSENRLNVGTVSLQAALAWTQRLRNTQPEGRSKALGSPLSAGPFLRPLTRIDGVAAISARV